MKRKNRAVEEVARVMLNKTNFPKYFWYYEISIVFEVMNIVLIRPILKVTSKYLSPSCILMQKKNCVLNNGKDNFSKFDAKVDEDLFLGYSTNSKAFCIYNTMTMTIEESVHVTFDETNPKIVIEVEFFYCASIQ